MGTISVLDFKKLIREKRGDHFKRPDDLVYGNFVRLGFDKWERDDFINKASLVIEQLREECWREFRFFETTFNSYVISKLIPNEMKEATPSVDLIVSFCEQFSDHMYELNLSNTQSRRARAGAEFEYMIGLIFMGCQTSFEHQGSVSKGGLNKAVDLIVPNVESYYLGKENTVFISVKTTLRERGQEVLEEVKLLDKREIFLVTLDGKISSEAFSKFDYFGIKIVTTKSIKQDSYSSNPSVFSLEDLISRCLEVSDYGDGYKY